MLIRAGWSAQSAWLTSPTFGGISWLAHSTVQSGLWVDSNQRYDELVASQRFTLSDALARPDGARSPTTPPISRLGTRHDLYHYDQLYNRLNVGYTGPQFGYSPMPTSTPWPRSRRTNSPPATSR